MAADRHGSPDRVKVLLDTNALTLPAQFGLDLFRELERLLGAYEPVVLEGSFLELERLGRGAGKDAAAARVGHALAERCTVVRTSDIRGSVDDQIVRYAENTGSIVVTNDIALKKRLREKGIQVIGMRKRKILEIGG
ncbi:MAG: nucleotide-binding protein [Methanomicrobiales archaeon]|nr:nucleotide-binding protein [Methanomicrobiales archaeon]